MTKWCLSQECMTGEVFKLHFLKKYLINQRTPSYEQTKEKKTTHMIISTLVQENRMTNLISIHDKNAQNTEREGNFHS